MMSALRFELLGPLHDFHGEERRDVGRAFGKRYGGFIGQWVVLVDRLSAFLWNHTSATPGCPCAGSSSAALFRFAPQFKNKIKTVGVARQQLHFLCSDKENEAKESLALRWACLVLKGGNLNPDGSERSGACASPAGAEALESLSFCGGLSSVEVVLAFPLSITRQGQAL